MKYTKHIILFLLATLIMQYKGQCPPTTANLTYIPLKTTYCYNDNVQIIFTTTDPIHFLNWHFDGQVLNQYNSNITDYELIGLQSSGHIIIEGEIAINGTPCHFIIHDFINVSPPVIADAGQDQFIGVVPITQVVIGGSPTGSGGTSPLNYAWTPTSNFVNPSTPTSANPVVNPSAAVTNYVVVVTDIDGCTDTDNVNLYNVSGLASKHYYAILKKTLDAGYYNSINNSSSNILYFKFDEEYYVTGANLSYQIYNDAGVLVTSTPAQAEQIGDNRYALNVSSLTQGSYYRLYVSNAKNEIWQARIKIN